MTNAEKYRLTGIEAYNLSQELGEYLTIEKKAEGVFVSDINSFFVKATTPTLTGSEKIILKNIKGRFNTLFRNSDGYLILQENSAKEIGEELISFCEYNHLFQFIKERRRILY